MKSTIHSLLAKLKRITENTWFFTIAASLFVCAFFYQYLATGSKLIEGDFDYYAQMYEAFRVSILEYKQFPFWNPWMSGGVPLFSNPQFGLYSIQSLLVLPFGAIYGLKLAYVFYALAGFWGMYLLGRRILRAAKVRSLLVSYIWVFCGFFAGHGIMHFTFSLFFLLPWLIFFVANRKQKRSWIWLGLIESIIILSSVHYAFLMTAIAIALYFVFSIMSISGTRKSVSVLIKVTKDDVFFIGKTIAIVVILSGTRLLSALDFVSNNERVINSPEIYPTVGVLFQALFMPVAIFIDVPQNLQWGWWEYSMYTGMGVGLALIACILITAKNRFDKPRKVLVLKNTTLLPICILGLVGFALALGDTGTFSAFNILQQLPGFTQTRVPSRWLLMTMFAILILLMAWRTNTKLINSLLLLSMLELFFVFGPIQRNGSDQISLPKAVFSQEFKQYDNNKKHLNIKDDINRSYQYSTSKNIGQIYSDDSLINTLNEVYGTKRCGINIKPSCDLVLSDNASVEYWSPNKVILSRTAPGTIKLNMNTHYAWTVNSKYVFQDQIRLDPNMDFIISDASHILTLEYIPKYSIGWMKYKFIQLYKGEF